MDIKGMPENILDKLRRGESLINSKINENSDLDENLKKFKRELGVSEANGEIAITQDGINVTPNTSKEEKPNIGSDIKTEYISNKQEKSLKITIPINKEDQKYYRDCMFYGKPYTEAIPLSSNHFIVTFRDKLMKDASMISKMISKIGVVNDADLQINLAIIHLALGIYKIEIFYDGKTEVIDLQSKKLEERLEFLGDMPSYRYQLLSKGFEAFNDKIMKLEELMLSENF